MGKYMKIKTLGESMRIHLDTTPIAIKGLCDRHAEELIAKGIMFRARGNSRLVDSSRFIEWYMNH